MLQSVDSSTLVACFTSLRNETVFGKDYIKMHSGREYNDVFSLTTGYGMKTEYALIAQSVERIQTLVACSQLQEHATYCLK